MLSVVLTKYKLKWYYLSEFTMVDIDYAKPVATQCFQ